MCVSGWEILSSFFLLRSDGGCNMAEKRAHEDRTSNTTPVRWRLGEEVHCMDRSAKNFYWSLTTPLSLTHLWKKFWEQKKNGPPFLPPKYSLKKGSVLLKKKKGKRRSRRPINPQFVSQREPETHNLREKKIHLEREPHCCKKSQGHL
jgi:hypothetical protein